MLRLSLPHHYERGRGVDAEDERADDSVRLT